MSSATFKPISADGSTFRPDLPPRSMVRRESKTLVNTYIPIEVDSTEGDASPFVDLVQRLLPAGDDAEILLTYMASLVQNPGVKFAWCPILQGVEGNGKSTLLRCVAQAVGQTYTHWPQSADLGYKFNAWMERKVFIAIEEIHVRDRRDVLDTLKNLITNPQIEIQGKGADQRVGENVANFMAATNYKDAVPKTRNDRRYAPLFCAQQEEADLTRDGLTPQYFLDLNDWLTGGGYAVVTHYLQNRTLDARYNPARLCTRAPLTSSTEEAIQESLSPIEQHIIEEVEQGSPGFAGGWISTAMLARLIDGLGLSRVCPPNRRRDLLRKLGYVTHAGLPRGRTAIAPLPDGVRTTLYIKAGHPFETLTGGAVTSQYSNAQGPTMGIGLTVVPSPPVGVTP
jgi:hypothetical protein